MTADPYLTAKGLLANHPAGSPLSEDSLSMVMKTLRLIVPGISDEELRSVRRKLEHYFGISMEEGISVTATHEPWLSDLKSSINWVYWGAYKEFLRASELPPEVVRVLDKDTDNILAECGNPMSSNGFITKGLVMGDVQSGKTASYTGLINKAADAGYKVIVLLTGTIEELRSQTQSRLDEGFVGRNSNDVFQRVPGTRIGVGLERQELPNVLTSTQKDFLRSNADAVSMIPLNNLQQPVLLVMKKNNSALKNLTEYLDSQRVNGRKLSTSLFLLDDEADNASVNSRGDDDPTRINKQIRGLLERFDRVSYVAYTATPFANVFINPDQDDLFPSDFIYALNAPDNYIGVHSIFGENSTDDQAEPKHADQVYDLTDAESVMPSNHPKSYRMTELPNSLEDALGVFLLSSTIRDLRDEKLRHRSMLVNVSRFTSVQKSVATQLEIRLGKYQEIIRQYSHDEYEWNRHAELTNLKRLFEIHYMDCGFTWTRVLSSLHDSVASIVVLTINQQTDREARLNYHLYPKTSQKGRRVIAVGGLTLSRGLTLEGLAVSYFHRNSKNYDTLLQMGRWFGYRPGYDDLCRIWMHPEAQGWYRHLARVVSELRDDISYMHVNKQTPDRFGMRVRSHPESLLVTARNKMRNSAEFEISISYSLHAAETALIYKDPLINQKNFERLNQFVSSIGAGSVSGKTLWENVDKRKIAELLNVLQFPKHNSIFIRDRDGLNPLIEFIADNDIDSLKNWDVCLAEGGGSVYKSEAISVQARARMFEKRNLGLPYLRVNRQRVGDRSDEEVGVNETELAHAREKWTNLQIEKRAQNKKTSENMSAAFLRRYRSKPLLTIHILEPKGQKDSNSEASTKNREMMHPDEIGLPFLMAISLSFPEYEESVATKGVIYRLNARALNEIYGDDAGAEDNDEPDQ